LTTDGNVYSESVIIRGSRHQIHSYNPPKGIDIIFEPVVENIPDDRPQEFKATLVGSDILPEETITPREITKVLSDWRTIVSDRVRGQRKEPLKHTIDTFIERSGMQMSDQLKSRVDKLLPDDIVTHQGKKWARVFSGEVK
jgi:hypothetical protein